MAQFGRSGQLPAAGSARRPPAPWPGDGVRDRSPVHDRTRYGRYVAAFMPVPGEYGGRLPAVAVAGMSACR